MHATVLFFMGNIMIIRNIEKNKKHHLVIVPEKQEDFVFIRLMKDFGVPLEEGWELMDFNSKEMCFYRWNYD